MVTRTFDLVSLQKTLSPYIDTFEGFDIESWGEGSPNIVLTDGDENFCLFEYQSEGVFMGHIFCGKKRGREALSFGGNAITWMFEEGGGKVIQGLTPVENKAALFFIKTLGFTPRGDIETKAGLMRIQILTKQEWERLNG